METPRPRTRTLALLMTGTLTASGIAAAASPASAERIGEENNPAVQTEPAANPNTEQEAEAPAQCTPEQVTPETTGTFNSPPKDEDEDDEEAEEEDGGTEIRDHLADLVRSADDGSTIEMAMFQIRDNCVVDELVDAANDRDVEVQVMGGFRTKDEDDEYQRLAEGLNEDNDNEDTWAKACDAYSHETGCIGTGPDNSDGANPSKMHNKFALFSSVSGESDVVFTSTANLSPTEGGTAGWNSAYTDVGNADLRQRFQDYFDDLVYWDEEGAPWGLDYYSENPPETTGNVRSYFHPRNEDDDTIVNILDQVECSADSTIHVVNWHIGRNAVAAKLYEKSEEGCEVNVVVNQINYEACGLLTSQPPHTRMSVRGFTENAGDKVAHQKNMMIHENLPDSDRKVTFTGSHNFNDTSLAGNDENTVRIESDTIHDQFVENFEDVWNDSDQAVEHPIFDDGVSCRAVAP